MGDESLLNELLGLEARLKFAAFDHATALALGMRFVERARAESLPIVIDLMVGEQQLFHVAMPGSTPDNDVWVKRKAAVVRRFLHSSWYVSQLARIKGYDFHQKFLLDPQLFMPAGGCFPIIVKGAGIIGTIAVSGLPQAEDHALVVAVLEDFLG